MSIINDMLKDLDTQRVRRNGANGAVLQGLELCGDINTQTQKILAGVIAASILMMLAVFSWPYVKDIFAHTSIATSSSTLAAGTSQDEQDAPPRSLTARTTYAHITAEDSVISPENSRAATTEDGGIVSSETPEPGLDPGTHADRSSHIVTHQDSPQEHSQRKHQRAVARAAKRRICNCRDNTP